jgi:alkylation response protein AidB-like acyl-CoA dehydrogenase
MEGPGGDGAPIGDEVFLAGIGRLLAEMEASVCCPTAMGKVKGSDVARLGCEQLIDLVGPEAILPYGADGAIGDGAIEYAHRGVQVSATGGGSVEVFRTMIAQLQLGLPRPDYPGRRVFLTGDRPAAAAA